MRRVGHGPGIRLTCPSHLLSTQTSIRMLDQPAKRR